MANPYESPNELSQGPTGILETTREGWLEFRGNRTQEDWVALFQYSALRGSSARIYRMRRALLAILICIAGILVGVVMQSMLVILLTCSVGLVIWFRYPAMIKSSMKRAAENLARAGRNVAAFGEQIVTLTPTDVRTRNLYSWGGFVWPAIESLELTDDYLFIFLSTTTAIPIRLREFPDDASREKFVSTAFEYFEARNRDAVTADIVESHP